MTSIFHNQIININGHPESYILKRIENKEFLNRINEAKKKLEKIYLENNYYKFGEALKELRREAGLTQSVFSKKIGIAHQPTLSKIENDKSETVKPKRKTTINGIIKIIGRSDFLDFHIPDEKP